MIGIFSGGKTEDRSHDINDERQSTFAKATLDEESHKTKD